MANIRKSFNLRNGVQVDDDNFIVNPNGLVGIGTTIPEETLDIRGSARVSGILSANNLLAGNIQTINALNAGITSITSGIITASSGIVTYYGDGSKLLNLPTSQWLDIDVGLGFTSIYAQGFVGVGTVDPRYLFQVGGSNDLNNFQTGVGLNERGDINATGIVTASSFSGSGSALSNLNASNITSGTLSVDRLPIIPEPKLPDSFQVAGIITALGGFSGIAFTAANLVPEARVNIQHIASQTAESGISTISTRLNVLGNIGVNTDSPQSNIHLVGGSSAALQVTATQSSILVGRSLNPTQNSGELRFGNTSGLYPYSTGTSLDVINYDVGNINHYLHYGPAGVGTGNFNWIYAPDSTNTLMTLTYQGNLGIGVINPTNKLEVLGNSSFSNNVLVGENISIDGDLILGGDLVISTGSLNANIIGDLTGNVYSTSGISTFFDIDVIRDIFSFRSFIGIGTQPSSEEYSFQVVESFVVSTSGVGLGTDVILPGVEVSAQDAIAVFRGVGIGTTELRSAVDFGDAGTGVPESRQIIVPRVTTTQRGLLSPQNGAIIYNTSTNQFQGFVSPSWVDLGASSGIGAVVDDTSPQLGGNLSLNGKNITGTGNINVTGSIAANQVNISGLSTFAGITTVTGPTLFAKQLNVSGVVTASQLIRSGGTSSQFLKADGSVDSSTYLTSYTETDTLDSVTSRGNTTTNDISVGIVTATGGFTSGIGVTDPVQITVSGNVLTFTVAGVGSTSLTLF